MCLGMLLRGIDARGKTILVLIHFLLCTLPANFQCRLTHTDNQCTHAAVD